VIGAETTASDDRLRRIVAVTDAGLSQLDVSDLLDALLARVREVMDVETAVLLLLDTHARQLVTAAAEGLDEDVRKGFRMETGQGFAGRVAAEGRPVLIDDVEEVDEAELISPALRTRGLRSMLGVPVRVRGQVVGVVHVGSPRPRAFTPDDVQLLELVADRVGMATQASATTIDRAAALALQRSLLPTRLPRVPGVELAARYVPGQNAGVGGDWYDVFQLPSGWLGVVVGDVSGHGLASAVVMGRLRSALRAYALICADPADALTHLDRKIYHFEAGSLATVLYAMIPPDRSTVHLSLAGHPPPVLAAPGRESVLVTAVTDVPLGMGPTMPPRRTTVFDLVPGAVLVCCTDGLIERRGELIDIGLDRVRVAVRPGPAEEVCASLMAGVGFHPDDDIAVVALRRDP
jgi:putative methionine-R-sulfoxide reductase with GAF domain